MTDRDDGGPAFPRVDGYGGAHWHGISLRDAFAWQALPWCLIEFGGAGDDMKQPAEAAYEIADALIAERKRHD